MIETYGALSRSGLNALCHGLEFLVGDLNLAARNSPQGLSQFAAECLDLLFNGK